MFCSACGAKLSENSKFCFNCGARAGEAVPTFPPVASPKFVPATCTNCGAPLEVDPNLETAKCSHCGSAFLVDEAIQNYNVTVSGNLSVNGAVININGKNITNLLERACEYAKSGDFEQARSYFNEVLDSDITNKKAKNGIKLLDDIINGYSYKSESLPEGKLELKKGRLLLTREPSPILFELSRVFDLNVIKRNLFSAEKAIQFTYHGIPQRRVMFNVNDANTWYKLIEDAKMGKYPQMKNLGSIYSQREKEL